MFARSLAAAGARRLVSRAQGHIFVLDKDLSLVNKLINVQYSEFYGGDNNVLWRDSTEWGRFSIRIQVRIKIYLTPN